MLRILYEELMIFSIDNVWPLFLSTIATSVFFILSRKITYMLLSLIAKYNETLYSMISLIFKPILKVVEVVYKTTAAMFAITLLMVIINKIF